MKATGRRYKPPSMGRWDVAREGCLKKARSELERRIALIHAPSGYGKTTLAAQICADDSRPAAWLTLRHTDNNPRLLLERLFCALAEVEQFSLKNRVTEWSRSLSESSGFLDALHDRRPTQLVLDDFQVLRNDIAVNVIRALTSEWPTGSRLILISQTEPEISKSRIRVSHDLTEITHADLAFSLQETTQVLKSGDPGWTDSEIAELQSLTEGWPAGVALADVAHFDSEDASAPLVQPEGLREVAEYFLDEVLGKQTPECREFMLSISVVDRFSAPLCNAMTGRRDAAGLIEHLRRENAFLVPLDREGHWYRFHRLLRETLRTELERRHPRDGRTRLLRASTWHENEGSPEEAFEYARRIGHFDRAGFTLLRHWEEFARRGQIETVRRWLERCSEAQIESDPKMAIAAGWIAGYGGETLRIRRYLRAAEKCDLDMPSPDGASTLRASMMSLRSTVGLDGVSQVLRDGLSVCASEAAAGTRWLVTAHQSCGIAYLMLSDVPAAILALENVVQLAKHEEAVYLNPVFSLGYLSLAYLDAGQIREARRCHDHATRSMSDHRMTVSGVPVHVARAAILTQDNLQKSAQIQLELLSSLVPLAEASPLVYADLAIRCAESAHNVGRDDLGADFCRVARQASSQIADTGSLSDRLRRIEGRLLPTSMVSLEALTPAELRVLQQLKTHRNLQGIANHLFVSRATVKTHVASIYGKLGVATRSEAVAVVGEVDSEVHGFQLQGRSGDRR